MVNTVYENQESYFCSPRSNRPYFEQRTCVFNLFDIKLSLKMKFVCACVCVTGGWGGGVSNRPEVCLALTEAAHKSRVKRDLGACQLY